MASEKNEPVIDQILQAIGDFRREVNERFAILEAEIAQIKQSQFTSDVRLDRLQALAHGDLKVGHELKADVKALTAEVRVRSADVAGLQHPV